MFVDPQTRINHYIYFRVIMSMARHDERSSIDERDVKRNTPYVHYVSLRKMVKVDIWHLQGKFISFKWHTYE